MSKLLYLRYVQNHAWSKLYLLVLGIMYLFATINTVTAQQDGLHLRDDYQYRINRSLEPIKIDGVLSEEIWSQAQKATSFFYIKPIDNKQVEAGDQTEVMMTYDDKNIYVAAICKGESPYLVTSLKRDGSSFWDGDTFMVSFDPGNERTNGYGFGTNAAGVQFDTELAGNLGTRNGGGSSGFNRAWNNKWVCETKIYEDHYIIEIAIPFKTLRYGESEVWGVQFNRGNTYTNSFHAWTPVPRQFFGPDLGYNGSLLWDEAPKKAKSNIALIPYTLTSVSKNIEDNQPADLDIDIGLDAKVALTSSLNLDVTINPDFSQVDVDRQVTNLTNVNIRFPEQRIFFVENSDIFSNFGIPPMRPFFSRKIGLREDGSSIPIRYGVRLTGNLSKDTRIGMMNLQTKSLEEEPGNNYSALAFNHRIFGRSVIKGFLHNRIGYSEGGFVSDDYMRNMGLEFDYRSKNGYNRFGSALSLSYSDGVNDQNAYYHALAQVGNQNFRFYVNLAGIGKNYGDDMGFVQQRNQYDAVSDEVIQIGYDHLYSNISYTLFPQNEKINTHRFSITNIGDWERSQNQNFNYTLAFDYDLALASTSSLTVGYSNVYRRLLYPFTFTDNPLPAAGYRWNEFEIEYESDVRKELNFTVGGGIGGFYSGDRKSLTASLNYRQQPWGNFGVNFEANELNFDGDIGNSTLLLIGPQLEINFNRDLFWTTFVQYNTQRDNFNINSRFQWRFQPLSDLFLVYTDNYAIEQWGPKNRTLVLKVNYWLNI